jgi:hypothetical protein
MLWRLLLFHVVFCGLMVAEIHTGRIRAGERPIPGATVRATSQGREAITTSSDEQGNYTLDLSPGEWTLSVEMFGFAPGSRSLAVGTDAAPVEWALRFAAPDVQAPTRPQESRLQPRPTAPAANQADNQEVGVPPVAVEEAGAGESFLLNGSLSRGLQSPRQEDYSFSGMTPPMSLSMQEPPMAGEAGVMQGGAPGFGGSGTAGGFGGGGGMSMGGGGGPRGRAGGIAGPRGPGGRMANLSPEQQARMRERMQRAQDGGFGQAFGNRRPRAQAGIRGMISYQIGNSALDARPYSLSGETFGKSDYAQNRLQLMLGGPLRIPKLIDSQRTFFNLTLSGNLDRSPYNGTTTVPTAAQRMGDLSQVQSTIYDPLSGQPFPGNVVPGSRINEASRGLLRYMPLPNSPGLLQNYSYVTALDRDSLQANLRLNHALTNKHRLSGGFTYQRRTSEIGQLFGWTDSSSGSGSGIDLGWSYSIRPSMNHDLRVRLHRDRNETMPFFANTQNVAAELGIAGPSNDPVTWGPPNLGFTNYGDLNEASAVSRRNQTFTISDGLSIVKGSHTVSLGAEFSRRQLNTNAFQDARGSFAFTGLLTSAFDAEGNAVRGTGYDLADYLLGLPQSSTIRFSPTETYFRGSAYAFYVQEEWRARPNLTFNLGLRYDYTAPYAEKYGRLANLDVAADFSGVAVVTPVSAGPYTGSFPKTLIDPDRNNFSPRLGFAWKPNNKYVVRGGYSIFYDSSAYQTIATQFAGQPPFAQSSSLTTSLQRVLTINNGFGNDLSKTVTNTYAVGRDFRLPYAQTWNFAVQRDLPFNLMMEVGYLGTKGTRLDMLRQPNRAAPGAVLTAEERRLASEAGNYTYRSSEGNSIFHAAQLRVIRRLRRGLSIQGLYTFSKSIDNASLIGGSGNIIAQDDRNFAAERGLSSFDVRHNLRLTGMMNSPFGEGGLWFKNQSWQSRLLKDWTLSTSISARSGQPFTARVLGNAADTAGTGSVGSSRASATGLSVSSGEGFLNPAAFTLPAVGEFGNAGRNTIPGPGLFTLGVSFGRQFRLRERSNVEIRVQSENVLNNVNYASINTVVNSIQFALPTAVSSMRTITANVRFRF